MFINQQIQILMQQNSSNENQFSKLQSLSDRKYLSIGVNSLQDHEYFNVIECFQQIIKVDPTFEQALQALRLMKNTTKQYADKQKYLNQLNKLISHIPENILTLSQMGLTLQVNTHQQFLLRNAEGNLKSDKDCDTAKEMLQSFKLNYEVKKCLHFCLRVNIDYLNILAVQKMNRGDYAGSLWHLDKINQMYPKDCTTLIMIATCYFRKNQYNKAIVWYQKAYEILPNSKDLIIAIAWFYLQIKHFKKAILYYHKALLLGNQVGGGMLTIQDDEKINVIVKMAMSYLQINDLKKAIEYYHKALKINSNNVEVLNFLGQAYLAKQDHRLALMSFQRAIRLSPKNTHILAKLGYTSLLLDNIDQCFQYCESALQNNPSTQDKVFLLLTVALAFRKQGNIEKAIASYKYCLRLNLQYPITYKSFAELLLSIDDYKQAIKCYEKALELDPKDIEIIFTIGSIYCKDSRYQEGLGYIEAYQNISNNYSQQMKEKIIITIDSKQNKFSSFRRLHKIMYYHPQQGRTFSLILATSFQFTQRRCIFHRSLKDISSIGLPSWIQILFQMYFLDKDHFDESDLREGTSSNYKIDKLRSFLAGKDEIKLREFLIFIYIVAFTNSSFLLKFDHVLERYMLNHPCFPMFLKHYLKHHFPPDYEQYLLKKYEDAIKTPLRNVYNTVQLFCLSLFLRQKSEHLSKANYILEIACLQLVNIKKRSQQQYLIISFLRHLFFCTQFRKNYLLCKINLGIMSHMTLKSKEFKNMFFEGLQAVCKRKFIVSTDQIIYGKGISNNKKRIILKYLVTYLYEDMKRGSQKQIIEIINDIMVRDHEILLKHDAVWQKVKLRFVKKLLIFLKREQSKKHCREEFKRSNIFTQTSLNKYNILATLYKSFLAIRIPSTYGSLHPFSQSSQLELIEVNFFRERFLIDFSRDQHKMYQKEDSMIISRVNQHYITRLIKSLSFERVLSDISLKSLLNEEQNQQIRQIETSLLLRQLTGKQNNLLSQTSKLEKYLKMSPKGKKYRRKKVGKKYKPSRKQVKQLIFSKISLSKKPDFTIQKYQELSIKDQKLFQKYYQLFEDLGGVIQHPLGAEFQKLAHVVEQILQDNNNPKQIFNDDDASLEKAINNQNSVNKHQRSKKQENISHKKELIVASNYTQNKDSFNSDDLSIIMSIQASNQMRSQEISKQKDMSELNSSSGFGYSQFYQNYKSAAQEANKFHLFQGDQQKKFDQLLFKNHAYLIRYLFFRRNSFEYIAKYYFDEGKVKKNLIDDSYTTFQVQMEKGLEEFILARKHQDNKHYILLLKGQGYTELIHWINCFVSGILELQYFGIFHADLCLRNTIKVVHEKEGTKQKYRYKIIDFDFAFKVDKPENQSYQALLNHTKQIIAFWLNSNWQYDDDFLSTFLLKDCQKVSKIAKKRVQDIKNSQIDFKVKVEDVLKEMKYMLTSHKYQLTVILQEVRQCCPECQLFEAIKSTLQSVSTESHLQNRKGYENLLEELQKSKEKCLLNGW